MFKWLFKKADKQEENVAKLLSSESIFYLNGALSAFRAHRNMAPLYLKLRDGSSVMMDTRLISPNLTNVLSKATPEEAKSLMLVADACKRWSTFNNETKQKWLALAVDIITNCANRALVPQGQTPDEARDVLNIVVQENRVESDIPIVAEIKSIANDLKESHRSYKLRWQRVMLLITEIKSLPISVRDEHFTALLEKVKGHKDFYSKISFREQAASEVTAELIKNL